MDLLEMVTKLCRLHSAKPGFDSACVLVRSLMDANAVRQTYSSISARLTARLAALQVSDDPTPPPLRSVEFRSIPAVNFTFPRIRNEQTKEILKVAKK